MSLTELGKYMALLLRHKPETAGIKLDEHGWADVDMLIAGIQKTHPFNRDMLQTIVARDSKQRYSFNEDGTKIRANQGHSIPVDVELQAAVPPAVLFHGTALKSAAAIKQDGLKPMSRLYVHLSKDERTAETVGRRHGNPVIFRVDSGKMADDGFVFYLSKNGVWLTKSVPSIYLEQLTKTGK
ncbi:MAG: RNA 2'-phosphotransferase [Clostridia bacterium]|nr:RNA 2'-phosphotransferase [Clostridia bacterium]